MHRVRTVVLDNEPVQALLDSRHRKHRRVMGVLEALTSRNLRRADTVRLVVPTAVRVEAGWDRRAARTAVINRLRALDDDLDSPGADRAVRVRAALGVSVVDAALAVALHRATVPAAVLTSDVEDARRVADHLGLDVTVVPL